MFVWRASASGFATLLPVWGWSTLCLQVPSTAEKKVGQPGTLLVSACWLQITLNFKIFMCSLSLKSFPGGLAILYR